MTRNQLTLAIRKLRHESQRLALTGELRIANRRETTRRQMQKAKQRRKP